LVSIPWIAQLSEGKLDKTEVDRSLCVSRVARIDKQIIRASCAIASPLLGRYLIFLCKGPQRPCICVRLPLSASQAWAPPYVASPTGYQKKAPGSKIYPFKNFVERIRRNLPETEGSGFSDTGLEEVEKMLKDIAKELEQLSDKPLLKSLLGSLEEEWQTFMRVVRVD